MKFYLHQHHNTHISIASNNFQCFAKNPINFRTFLLERWALTFCLLPPLAIKTQTHLNASMLTLTKWFQYFTITTTRLFHSKFIKTRNFFFLSLLLHYSDTKIYFKYFQHPNFLFQQPNWACAQRIMYIGFKFLFKFKNKISIMTFIWF